MLNTFDLALNFYVMSLLVNAHQRDHNHRYRHMDYYLLIHLVFYYNIGSLMLKYKGGGHHFVGTCQFDDVNDKNIDTIIDVLKTESRKESAV